MALQSQTAAELLKIYGLRPQLIDMGGVLRRLFEDKAFSISAAVELSRQGIFAALLQRLLMRIESTQERAIVYGGFGSSLQLIKPAQTQTYLGTPKQNMVIDRAFSTVRELRDVNNFFGHGSANNFSATKPNQLGRIAAVPIAVVGYGAAGISTAFALKQLGFTNVSIFEKRSEPYGIWAQRNVFGRSRNNPLRLSLYDKVLNPAPGLGAEVKTFLEQLKSATGSRIDSSKVLKIEPGNLHHVLSFEGKTVEFPIVVNAIGLGKPKPVSDIGRMTSNADSRNWGIRWQQELTAEDVKRKLVCMIGLGNSTAEMLRQIHDIQDAGGEVDYRIVTHYPLESVANPDTTVFENGQVYRVFRDLATPNLTSFQGDLADSRSDYFRALRAGKIVAGVKQWRIDDAQNIGLLDSTDSLIGEFHYDLLYTLIGYQHTVDVFERMGIAYDVEGGFPRYDFDGEFRSAGSNDIAKGYYGIGAVLDAPHNKNSIVIPGMLFRLGDLLFGIVMRAAEYIESQVV